MRIIFPIALVFSIILSGFYLVVSQPVACAAPIHYHIGALDSRFNLSTSSAEAAIDQAVITWEKTTSHDLFTYDEQAPFTINFVYDDRQDRVVTEEAVRAVLDQKEQTSTEIAAKYKALNTQYLQLSAAYEARVTAHNVKLKAFNDTVARYNSSGGAPGSAFTKLQIEEAAIKQEAADLETSAAQLKIIVAKLNQLGDQGNQLIAQYNTGVQSYNATFGETSEFTQGDYQRDKIDIYKFSNESELVKVLMHEFGHALGLSHVEGSSSIMYYLMQDQPNPPMLTPEDLAAFTTACGGDEGIFTPVRQFITHYMYQKLL